MEGTPWVEGPWRQSLGLEGGLSASCFYPSRLFLNIDLFLFRLARQIKTCQDLFSSGLSDWIEKCSKSRAKIRKIVRQSISHLIQDIIPRLIFGGYLIPKKPSKWKKPKLTPQLHLFLRFQTEITKRINSFHTNFSVKSQKKIWKTQGFLKS